MPDKYVRLTVPAETGYEADGLMATERLGRLEDAIERIQKEYHQTQDALNKLAGKEKTAMYQQLLANQFAIKELMIRLGI